MARTVREVMATQLCEIGLDAIYSGADVASVAPDTPLDHAAAVMRAKAVRRLPVMEGDRVVRIVSIGDLAVARDRNSALGDISATAPNR